MLLSLKSKYIIKGAIAQMEKKQGKLIYASNPSENHNIQKQKLNENNTSLAK